MPWGAASVRTAEEGADARTGIPQTASVLRSVTTFGVFVVVLCPAVVLMMGLTFGALLAEVEGWSLLNGFFYVLGNLTGLVLTYVSPESEGGKVFDVLVAVWSLSVAGCIFGVLGSLNVVNLVVKSVRVAAATERQ